MAKLYTLFLISVQEKNKLEIELQTLLSQNIS